jgi:hypothetical protein
MRFCLPPVTMVPKGMKIGRSAVEMASSSGTWPPPSCSRIPTVFAARASARVR